MGAKRKITIKPINIRKNPYPHSPRVNPIAPPAIISAIPGGILFLKTAAIIAVIPKITKEPVTQFLKISNKNLVISSIIYFTYFVLLKSSFNIFVRITF